MSQLTKKITALLMKRRPIKGMLLTDFNRLCYSIRPGDILLFAGRSRVSDVISHITQSPWTHAALYIGRLHDIADPTYRKKITNFYPADPSEQLLIESVMGKGTVVTPISYYREDHIRICRPTDIRHEDAQHVINYVIDRLGFAYDVRQIFDLMRFMLPWSLLPRRWRSSLFNFKAGVETKLVCSTLLAQAFLSVHYPILPFIHPNGSKLELVPKIPRLFTPSDFDFSPYFEIIKYPMFQIDDKAVYRHLPWTQDGKYSDENGNLYEFTKQISETKE